MKRPVKKALFTALACVLSMTCRVAAQTDRIPTPEELRILIHASDSLRNNGELAEALRLSVLVVEQTKAMSANDIKVEAHVNLSNTLKALDDEEDAINNLYLSIHLNKKRTGNYELHDGIRMGTIGSYHMVNGQMDSCIVAFKSAISIIEKLDNPLYLASAYNNLGLAYSNTKSFGRAIKAFEKAISLLHFDVSEQFAFKAIILENIADVERSLGNFQEAKELIEESLTILRAERQKAKGKAAPYYKALMEVKVALGEVDDLRADADSFFIHYHNLRQRRQFVDAIQVINLLLENGYSDNNALQVQKQQFSDSLIAYQTGQVANVSSGLLAYKQSILDQQNTIMELQKVEATQALKIEKARYERFQLIGLIALVVFVATIFVLIDRARRKRRGIELEKKMTSLELENQKLVEQKLEQELATKKSDILYLALDNAKKLEWNNELISKLKDLRRANERDIGRTLKDIEIQMGQQLHSDNQTEVLKTNVEQVNQEFTDKLISLYPMLTRNELELCGYLKLRLSGSEIASIRNVDPKSVTKSKQRLKKKLGLQGKDDLYQFFHKI